MKKGVTPLLWTLVVLNVVLTLVNAVFPNHIPVPLLIPLLIVVPLAFALLHGAVRYQWSGILTFLVICLVVSNVLENTSILTGFPFGHYYYTSDLGPKLFLVPLVIGPAYFGTGYLAWMLSTVLIGDARWATSYLHRWVGSRCTCWRRSSCCSTGSGWCHRLLLQPVFASEPSRPTAAKASALRTKPAGLQGGFS